MKILLVEDDNGVSHYLRTIMTPLADTVHIVRTLTECHEAISRETYDAILLDLKLADAGASMTIGDIPKIKKQQPKATLIVNTALGSEWAKGAKDAGADMVVEKGPETLERKAFCAALLAACSAKGNLSESMEML